MVCKSNSKKSNKINNLRQPLSPREKPEERGRFRGSRGVGRGERTPLSTSDSDHVILAKNPILLFAEHEHDINLHQSLFSAMNIENVNWNVIVRFEEIDIF
jgi:hypothetical protein